MTEATFTDYSINWGDKARKQRLALATPLRRTVDDIEADLCTNPDGHPERLSPGSRDGKVSIYRHPMPEIQITFEVDYEKKVIYVLHCFAPTFSPQPTIFISYAHEDKDWLRTLRRFLTAIDQQGLIKFWDDSELEAGVPWEKQISDVLKASQAGLLLISQNFLASQFVKDVELPRLLEEAAKAGKKMYWLPLSPSTVFKTHKEITAYQSLLSDPEISIEELDKVGQEKAFVQVANTLMDFAS
jgi:hypothetical protein